MKKLLHLLCLIIIFVPLPLQARNFSAILSADSPLYDDLEALYASQNRVVPSLARPLSEAEFMMYLSRLDYSLLDKGGQRLYRSVLARLWGKSLAELEGLDFRVGLEAILELHGKTRHQAKKPKHDYSERKALLKLPLELRLFNLLTLHMGPELREHPPMVQKKGNYSNIMTGAYEIDSRIPHRAYISLAQKHWTIHFGRDRLNWGNGLGGNLLQSGAADFHEFLALSVHWPFFKYCSHYLALDPYLTEAEKALEDDFKQNSEPYRALISHRIELRILERVFIGLTEAALFGRKYPELRYLNPMAVFHNWFDESLRNSVFSVELNALLFRGFQIYGQFLIDQFQLPVEKENWEKASRVPNAFGGIAGLRFERSLGPGILYSFFEWTYTNPWLYTDLAPMTRYLTRQVLWADQLYVLDQPLGHWSGPDSLIWELEARYQLPDLFSAGIGGIIRIKGENTAETILRETNEAVSLRTPSGEFPQKELSLHFFADFKSPRLNIKRLLYPFFKAGFDLYLNHYRDYEQLKGNNFNELEWSFYGGIVF